jgi:hypothetical protein
VDAGLTVRTALPGTGTTLGVPARWRTATDPVSGLLSVEPDTGRFLASVTVVLDRSRHEALPDPVAAATAMLVAPAVVHVDLDGGAVDLVVCHLAGSVSATMRQRQLLIPEGMLAVTFTAATSRWSELCAVADEVMDSIGVAA